MKKLLLLALFAILVPVVQSSPKPPASFTFIVNSGLEATVEAITITTPEVKLFTGQLTAGNPKTAATFRACNDECVDPKYDVYEFKTADFDGSWDGPALGPAVVWEQAIGSTYLLIGSVSGEYKGEEVKNVPVVIVVNGVKFTDKGWGD